MRKLGPAPVWVYFIVGVLGVAWIVKRRQDAKAAQAQPEDQSAALSNMQFPSAQPMNYSSDIFINVPAPANNSGGVINTQPPPVPTPKPNPNPGPGIPENKPPLPIPLPVPHPLQLPVPTPAPKQKSITYVVKSGDTLWDIAKKYLGSGTNYTKIYQLNKTLLEAEAKKHGFSSSNNGARIWAGEKLVIPVG